MAAWAWSTKPKTLRLDVWSALKFLPEDTAQEPAALERFRREARAASALNHPNICTIYEIGEHDGRAFIAMEFLDGMTLRQRIGGRPLETEDLWDWASRLPTHWRLRMRKASSIATSSRPIFSLPRTDTPRCSTSDWRSRPGYGELRKAGAGEAETALIAEPLTGQGSALGTVAYMSPEQARAKELDSRTDLFSFGAVLYEMATGKRAFHGESDATIYDAILNREPEPPEELNPKSSSEAGRDYSEGAGERSEFALSARG